ncbi:ribosome small subunit-dependent GTPase A [Enterococcus mundtii]|uniref:Small ribosomal subunit biogenesis GTPase RsgA n=1 Tax=Enterococcus mundtii TaxID=53346 RepID=A0A1I4KKA1_ENTMU|nr:ribosome small subunit-dependent GTPase A [Enterococcus mundtii]OTP27841.1 ribosome small subunit-dependent GTPase A [Enterococcus mundtii]SFL79210.1 ribosome biogenesis GTPase [Enterococcus mundtii]STD25234.1 ribosome small subunit-dependent GTPase A [Enterococcus mundtii]
MTTNKYHVSLIRGRVTISYGSSYQILSNDQEISAKLSGSLKHQSTSQSELPVVGDWVKFQLLPDNKGIIHSVDERFSKFSRKTAGNRSDEQIIATNIDWLFIVSSLNNDFNLRRIERYLVAGKQSGAKPIVILTKADLCPTIDLFLVPLYTLKTDIIVTSFDNEQGIQQIADLLADGKTGALVGSSGVGKSTLVNRLMKAETMHVSVIREEDDRGRHTTTHRELLTLPTGGFLIDTPGMREFQPFQEEQLDSQFEDIVQLSFKCRFRNCRHNREKDCAIKQAIDSGELSENRYRNYLKLQKELLFQEKRIREKEKLKNRRKRK